jgi:hypothetical protein
MIHRFGLFVVSHIPCMLHSYFLSIFLWSFTVSSNSSTLSSVPVFFLSVTVGPAYTEALLSLAFQDEGSRSCIRGEHGTPSLCEF